MFKFSAMCLALIVILSACAIPSLPTKSVIDEWVSVSEAHRDVRACLLTVMVIEAGTDRVRLFDPTQAPEVMGRLMAMSGVVGRLRERETAWTNTEMADVTFLVARALIAGGKSRLAKRIMDGLSTSGILEAARRFAVTSFKTQAMLLDIELLLADLEAGDVDEPAVWAACDERIKHNRDILANITGAQL